MGASQHAVITVPETSLPIRAVKIKDVVAAVASITWEVIAGKVIVQAIIHVQVFFVGVDGVVRQIAENVPLATLVLVPGASPGMEAQVTAAVEHVSSRLAKDGTCVRQNMILKITVKVAAGEVDIGTSNQLVLVAAWQAAGGRAVRTVAVRSKQPLAWTRVGVPEKPSVWVRPPEPEPPAPAEGQVAAPPEEETVFEGRFVLLGKILAQAPPVEVREPVLISVGDVAVETSPDTVQVSGVVYESLTFRDEGGMVQELHPTLPFKERIFAPGVAPGDQVRVDVEVEELLLETGELPGELEESVVIKIMAWPVGKIWQT